MTEFKPGYHLRPIQKGVFGEFSKIREEFDELSDAYDQGSTILQLVELSDLIGAIGAYAESLDSSLQQLIHFKTITERAFKNGHR